MSRQGSEVEVEVQGFTEDLQESQLSIAIEASQAFIVWTRVRGVSVSIYVHTQ